MFLGQMEEVVGGEGKAIFLIRYREVTCDAHQQALLRMVPLDRPECRQLTNQEWQANQWIVLAGRMIA